jgi:hypothetical protein
VPEGLLGGLITDLFVDAIIDSLLLGTGTIALKIIRPDRPANRVIAVLVGLVIWLVVIAALLTIGYFLLV